ncbi:dehydrogenase [Cohnella suwonensis]|uniref:Dehydrogenase n=1 Tax=Cohnella suwonensis TaxID=696072 RepID=A0ABW0LS74_9BACL
MKMFQEKHTAPLPSQRTIRRACANELYRTVKRLKRHVPAALVEEAEKLYVERVIGNLLWIHDHRSNRKALADWWDETVRDDIAKLWGVDGDRLSHAFRGAFGA